MSGGGLYTARLGRMQPKPFAFALVHRVSRVYYHPYAAAPDVVIFFATRCFPRIYNYRWTVERIQIPQLLEIRSANRGRRKSPKSCGTRGPTDDDVG
jgi:hypothetical protein